MEGMAPWIGAARTRRGLRLLVSCAVAMLMLLVGLGGVARADFAIQSFTTGASSYEAGAHADVTTRFVFSHVVDDQNLLQADGHVRRLEVDMPQGLVGDPTEFVRCRREQFRDGACPAETQVGAARIDLATYPAGDSGISPIYNLEPSRNEPALLGVRLPGLLRAYIRIAVRADGGLTAVVDDLPFGSALINNELTLWGVPADHNGSGAERRPFMANPTKCGEVPVTTLRAWSYEEPERVHTATSTNDVGHGCDTLRFAPTMTAVATNRAAAAPTGLDVVIDVPQSVDPDGRATAHVRGVELVLPEGMSVSPSSANGLGACSEAEFGYRTNSAVTCPDASKIGTLAIETPLLDDPMQGSVYLAKQNANPFGSLLALYLVAKGNGVTIKLAGRVSPDPVTGRLTTTFADNPQLPFSRLTLSLKDGPRAPLFNPRTCGTFESETRIASWGGQTASARTPMTVDQDCQPVGFNPAVSAGTTDPVAGAFSTFSLTFARGDHDQELRDITVDMPAGLTGVIANAEMCSDAAANAGACGEGSRIGSVTTASGPGAQPYWLPGRAYLTGPYDGAPLGMVFVVPAVAGPFDLGTVVVRAAIHVDRRNAALRIVSKPLPRILQGIPLQIRSVNVAVDKPRFMLNPTSCSPKTIGGRITSYGDAVATTSTRFQVGDCAKLPVAPRMSMRVGARGRTKEGITTPFTATLTQTPGQGNLRVVDVNLPRMLNSRLEVVSNRNACSPEQFAADRCPQVVGTAVAVTPLLRDPMRGNVYFVKNPARKLPDIVAALRGTGVTSGIRIDVTGKVQIERDQSLRTIFDTIPDVPISMFSLRLVAGKNGPIGTVQNLCTKASRRETAKIGFRGQNGRFAKSRQRLSIAGCGKASARRPSSRRGSRRAGSRRGGN